MQVYSINFAALLKTSLKVICKLTERSPYLTPIFAFVYYTIKGKREEKRLWKKAYACLKGTGTVPLRYRKRHALKKASLKSLNFSYSFFPNLHKWIISQTFFKVFDQIRILTLVPELKLGVENQIFELILC